MSRRRLPPDPNPKDSAMRDSNPTFSRFLAGALVPAAAAALLATAALPSRAAVLTAFSTTGASTVTDFSGAGLVAFDIDLEDTAPVALTFALDAGDIGGPLAFNAVVRNLIGAGPGVAAGLGLGRIGLALSTGTFSSIGTVTRAFGGSTATGGTPSDVELGFQPVEFFDVEIGNAFGTTTGAQDWLIDTTAFKIGDRFTLTITSAVPEPGTWALALAGLGFAAGVMRRRRG